MKTAVVTGAASGIGAALCAELVKGGANVVLADVDLEAAARAATALGKAGSGNATAAALDVRDSSAVQELVDRTVSAHGGIELMVNNAGIGVGGKATDLDLEHWDRAIDVNLRGVIHGIHAVLPHMVEAGSGQIVNTASLAGLVPNTHMAPYVASKHAVVGLTLSLRIEYANRGVGFTCVCPGFTDTALLDSRGPEDLLSVSSAPDLRRAAGELPGGIYAVEALAKDIMSGLGRNEALVVAPRSAQATWQAWRASPDEYLNAMIRRSSPTAPQTNEESDG